MSRHLKGAHNSVTETVPTQTAQGGFENCRLFCMKYVMVGYETSQVQYLKFGQLDSREILEFEEH